MKTTINEKEILRYLGYQGHQADNAVLEHINELQSELKGCLSPRYVYDIWKCGVSLAGTVEIGNVAIKSKHLANHMQGCGRVVLLAATLGIEADTLIKRYSVTDIAKAVVAQAACAAMLESLCDELEQQIMADELDGGLCIGKRFSPGYGDFDIRHQKDILSLLERKKRIGITLTNSYMMIPAKSVTALIGIAEEKRIAGNKCESCADLQCKYREEHRYETCRETWQGAVDFRRCNGDIAAGERA